MKQRQNVVLGFLGSVLDVGRGPDRWESWRPTISVCRQADLLVHRFELLYSIKQKTLAELIKRDIQTVSPETEVHLHNIEFTDPWDFEEVYAKLFDFTRAYSFNDAAKPDLAIPLYERFVQLIGTAVGRPAATGRFGAMMDVSLVNAGPVTLIIDSHTRE